MINITLNDDYSLSVDSNIIPAQHSANILFHLTVPEKYNDSIIIPGYIYYCEDAKIESAVSNYREGDFSIPSNGFETNGMLGIAFSIKTGDVIETTEIVSFEVRSSVNTAFKLPDKELWQFMLQNFMDQYMDKVYSSIINELISKTETLHENAENLQKKVNELIKTVNQLINNVNKKLEDGDFTLDYKFEGTVLYIKKHTDAEWGEGADLRGATTIILDNEVLNKLDLSTQRDESSQKVFVQLKDAKGRPVMLETSYENTYLEDSEGNEISLKNYASLVGQFVQGTALFDTDFDLNVIDQLVKFNNFESSNEKESDVNSIFQDKWGNKIDLVQTADISPQIFSARNNTAKLDVKAYEPIPLEAFGYLRSELFQVSNDGKYIEVIGDNISYAEIRASVQITSGTEVNKNIQIKRVRGDKEDGLATAAGYGTSFNINIFVPISECRKGDKFYIYTTTDSTINISTGGGYRTYLSMKKIA